MHENSGVYSVQSAYNMIQRQKEFYRREDNSSLWSRMWEVKAPPKVLNLIWRALSGCLPTKLQLYQKRVQIDTRCPICLNDEESILHCLVYCPQAAQYWRLVTPNLGDPQDQDFYSWLDRLLCGCCQKQQAEIVTVCWAIW